MKSVDTFGSLLPELCEIIPHLTALEVLFLHVEDHRNSELAEETPESTVSFSTFADALPSSLRRVVLVGLKFSLSPERFELFSGQDVDASKSLDLIAPAYLDIFPEESPPARPLLRLTAEDGSFQWYLPTVRPSAFLSPSLHFVLTFSPFFPSLPFAHVHLLPKLPILFPLQSPLDDDDDSAGENDKCGEGEGEGASGSEVDSEEEEHEE
jgi:hypothetical protein